MGTQLSDDRGERSRRYPSVSLREAIGLLEQVHRAVGLSGGSRDTLARALGHSSLNGSSKRKIGALVQYGLVDRDGERYRISAIGRQLLIPVSEQEHSAALAEAVRHPPIFQEIGSVYDQQPLPAMLANVLAREHGVLPQASAEVAATFVQSVEQAGLLSNGILKWTEGERTSSKPSSLSSNEQTKPLATSSITRTASSTPSSVSLEAADSQDYTIPLDSKGRKAHITLPTPVTTRDLERLAAWIAYMEAVVDEPRIADE